MSRHPLARMAPALAIALLCASSAWALTCPPDSVKMGNVCIDRYEASVWQIPLSNRALVNKVKAGKATLAALTSGGATALSPASTCSPGFPSNFPQSGQWTPIAGSNPPSPGVYAVAIPGVLPSGCISWFQAAQACRLSGKRLLTNLEWQDAASGTPDPGTDDGVADCNVTGLSTAVATGSRSKCRSNWGVFDMVGNVSEWVADWDVAPASLSCTNSTTAFGFSGTGDLICTGIVFPDPSGPRALMRGGNFFFNGTGAGVFQLEAEFPPSDGGFVEFGFRCAR